MKMQTDKQILTLLDKLSSQCFLSLILCQGESGSHLHHHHNAFVEYKKSQSHEHSSLLWGQGKAVIAVAEEDEHREAALLETI